MKKGIHPELHEVTINTTNGESFKTMSASSKLTIMTPNIDIYNHPAWTGVDNRALDSVSNVAKYKKKFSGFSVMPDASKTETTTTKNKDTKTDTATTTTEA